MILKNYDIVKSILEEIPSTRDSDARVYYAVLVKKGFDLNSISAKDLLELMHNKKVPHFETIRRSRAKVQEDNPGLCGTNKKERIKYANEVKQEIIQSKLFR